MKTIKVLSLDGGGIRGAFIASFLAELEAQLDGDIWEYFDLVAGTSTGGIIALALALGMPAAEIRLFYERQGAEIFGQSQKHFAGPWLAPKYSAEALSKALTIAFGEKRIGDARTRLVVPAVNLITGRPTAFKTPHLSNASSRDHRYTAVDVALATTAAPTYFKAAAVNQEGAYCDGGLWANNPALVAYVEAQRIAHEQGITQMPISMLSVGTGKRCFSLDPPRSAGKAWWATRIFDVVIDSQSQGADFMAGFLTQRDRYDRVTFELPDDSWSLDNTALLPRYLHLGREEAHRHVGTLKTHYFAQKAEPYAPAT